MKQVQELNLILELINKYRLPLSPILEYAIKEKLESLGGNKDSIAVSNSQSEHVYTDSVIEPSNDKDSVNETSSENGEGHISPSGINSDISIVDYSDKAIAVIGETKPYKDDLKAMGGYFNFRTQWGPAWIFSSRKRDRIQAYVDGDISVVKSWSDKSTDDNSARYIIKVEFPDGHTCCHELVWQTLIEVIKFVGPQKVANLNIKCMGDNLVSPRLNDNPRYRYAQKEIGDGLYVCTYSSTETKYKQILRINREYHLGLTIEKVLVE